MNTVFSAISHHANRDPDAPAILDHAGDIFSYAELVEQIQLTTDRLKQFGLQRGHRVATVTGGDHASAVLLLSVLGTAACCPVNPAWAETEIKEYLDALGAILIISTESYTATVKKKLAGCGVPLCVFRWDARLPAGGRLEPTGGDLSSGPLAPPRFAEDDAVLLRTSGTTSTGKIVALDTSAVLAGAQASVNAYRLTESDRRLNIMPFFHVQGLVGSLITSLLAGSSIVCCPAGDPARAVQDIATSGATWLSATPTMHRLMLKEVGNYRDQRLGLRFVRCGSGALTQNLRAELEAGYGVPVIESYGMSEAHQIASTPLPPDPDAAGMVPTGSLVAILARDNQISSEPEEPGEILIKGANVMRGYVWPPDMPSGFLDGWLRTGDMGYINIDGSLTISGRIKDLINTGGEKVSPYEVEAAMMRHTAVSEAVAFGIPDDILGERPAAVVIVRPGETLDSNEFRSFLGQYIAPHKIPQQVVQRNDIPVTPSGKVSRSSLAVALEDELAEVSESRAGEAGHELPSTATEAMLKGL